MFRIFPGRKTAIRMVFTHLLPFPSVLPTSLVLNLVLSAVAGLLRNKYKPHSLYCSCALSAGMFLYFSCPGLTHYVIVYIPTEIVSSVRMRTMHFLFAGVFTSSAQCLAYTFCRYLLLNEKLRV